MRAIVDQRQVRPTVDLPGIDDKRVGDSGEVVRTGGAEQVAVGIEVQHAGVRDAAGCHHPVLDGGDGATRAPDVVHHQGGTLAQQLVFRELQEAGPGEESGAFPFQFGREVHRSGEDVLDVHSLSQQTGGNDASPGDHDHSLKFGFELGQQVID